MRGVALAMLCLAAGAGCHHRAPTPRLHRTDVPVPVNGLSGLDFDGARLWSVAERDDAVVALHPTRLEPRVVPIDALPAGYDLESLAVLGDGQLALGTETSAEIWSSDDGQRAARIFLARVSTARVTVTGSLELPFELWGVKPAENQGIEGLCSAGGRLVAGIETIVTRDDRRYAPLAVRTLDGSHGGWQPFLLQLTSAHGKLSALDCRDGRHGIVVLAVERHFDVMRILRFELPGPSKSRGDEVVVIPEVEIDLTTETAKGHINVEGIATTADGVALITDNQYTSITGPTELVRLSLP